MKHRDTGGLTFLTTILTCDNPQDFITLSKQMSESSVSGSSLSLGSLGLVSSLQERLEQEL